MSSRLVSVVVLLAAALTAQGAVAQGLEWTTDLAVAQRTAAQTNRLVLVHFGGTWCPPCRQMEAEVFAKTGIGYAVMPNFVPVKVDVPYGEPNELCRQLGVTSFPSDIIMTPQGTVVARSSGFKAAPEYLAMLNQAAQSARAAQPVAATNIPPAPAQAAPAPYAAPPVAPMNPPPGAASPLAPGANAVAAPPPGAASPLVGMRTPPQAVAPASPVAPAPAAPMQPFQAQPAPAQPAVRQPVAPQPAPQPPAPAALAPRVVGPQPAGAPVGVPAIVAPVGVVPSTPPLGAAPQPAPAVQQVPAPTAAAGLPNLPPGSPPLALDGYCPVTVTEKMIWKRGDVRFGAIHRGRTYLFSSATEQAKFLARPDSFSPIMSGNDPVAWLEQSTPVPGKREFGVMFNDKMILFATAESREKFRADQNRYDVQIKQAMQAVGDGTLRR
jgi:thiol-disulfide isomerase/thioredoxin